MKFKKISTLKIWKIMHPMITIIPSIVIESADKNIECLIFRFIPWSVLITCWFNAPLIIDEKPNTARPNSPPVITSSKIPTFGIKSIIYAVLPIIKLITSIPMIEISVFGRVVIYLDNPATLLILDIYLPVIIVTH